MKKRRQKTVKALVVAKPKPPAKTDQVAEAVSAFIANIQGNFEIRKRVMDQLKPGVHYGKKGSNKSYLYQAGATIIGVGFQVQQGATEIRERVVDVEEQATPCRKAMIVEARCDLVSRITGQVVWQGRWRSASTLEPKYYPKDWDQDPPQPLPPTIQTMADLWRHREDVMTTATKRAFVDSMRMYAGMDDDFTQDEELVEGKQTARKSGRGHWRRRPKQGQAVNKPTGGEDRATGRQLAMLQKAHVDVEAERTKRGWTEGDLTAQQANVLMRECVGKQQTAVQTPEQLEIEETQEE